MKNVRKYKVESIEEIINYLYKEDKVLAKQFVECCDKIDNDEAVLKFWNLLTDCAYAQRTKNNFTTAASFITGAIIGTSVAAISKDLYYVVLPLLASQSIVTLNQLLINMSADSAEYSTQKAMDSMMILEPELYDIALCFNGWRRENIDTSEYDGKQFYKDLRKQLYEDIEDKEINNFTF